MEQRNTTGILILLLTAMLVTAGCGWFAGDEYPLSETPSSESRSSNAGDSSPRGVFARMVNSPYVISSVYPNEGPLAGGESVRLSGVFPGVSGAQLIYTVYFGDNIASYDFTAPSIMTGTETNVIVPPGDALGFVAIAMFDRSNDQYIIDAPDAYEYIDPFTINLIDPSGGILAGGTDVTISGRIPVTGPITSLADAQANYSVTFDGNAATFVPNGMGEFITTTAMYVQTPPGSVPGLVDVAVSANVYGTRTVVDGYRYLNDFEIFDLDPDSGPLSGLNTVIIEGSFPVAAPIFDLTTANAQYTAYFGTNVANFVVPPGAQPIISTEFMYVEAPPSPIATVVDVDVFSDADSSQAIVSDPTANDYEYLALMQIGEVYPDSGFLGVFTPVQVLARLPITAPVTDLAVANSIYQVEFDGIPATYNAGANPIIEITGAYGDYNAFMNMFTPPGTVVGPVDVELFDVAAVEPSSTLVDGYTYEKLMALTAVYPNSGPTTGFDPIDVLVDLPFDIEVISDLALADSYYQVQIDGNLASFDVSRPPLISTVASAAYYNHVFHMFTPVGTVGLKDMTLIDVAGAAPDDVRTDFYTYTGAGALGQWTDVVIEPNPVGPLSAGELVVTVTVTGTFPTNPTAFIVPQGVDMTDPGNAMNSAYRIPLDFLSSGVNTDGDAFATFTNEEAIKTVVFDGGGTEVLYADGHAAIYLVDENNEIIGDDPVDLSDSGAIGSDAIWDRHFIIDTLPPIMNVGAGVLADNDLVDVLSRPHGANGYLVAAAPIAHPYGPTNTFGESFPYSDDFIGPLTPSVSPGLNERGAQRFFNPMSISNGLDAFSLDVTFKPVVTVFFEDLDIFEHPKYAGIADLSTLNGDYFNSGATYRAPAGFESGTDIEVSAGARRTVLAAPPDPALLARWELQGGTNAGLGDSPAIADFETGGLPLTGGFVYENGLTDPLPVDELRSIWNIYGGFSPDNVPDPMRLVVKFAAADRAGIYKPRGDDDLPTRAIMTPRDHQLAPLQIWWMREVNTQFINDNIPADGITRNPNFSWTIANAPRPNLDSDDIANALYYVELWESDIQSVNPDDGRNGSYSRIDNFTTQSSSYIPPAGLLNADRWYIVSVMAVDEASNGELWPVAELNRSGSDTIDLVSSDSLQGSNWRRFYYPSEQSEVDTRVTFEFWHDNDGDGEIDDDEPYFGSQTVLPAPPLNSGISLLGRFEGTVIGNGLNPNIDWTLSKNGGTPGVSPVVIETPFGERERYDAFDLNETKQIGVIQYSLTARGELEIDGDTVVDRSPVNIRFIVVPEQNITTYLTNRLSEDQQPIIEFDRQ